MTKWYTKQGDSGVIAQGSADFDFVKPASAKRGDLIIARVGVRDGLTPAPVTSGDWTFVGSSPDTSNSTTGSDAALSQEFVWYHIYGNADPDWTFSRGGTTVALRGSITLAPAIGYEFDLVETKTGTNATGSTGPTITSFTTAEDDELIAAFLTTGRNATWTNWRSTSPGTGSGSSGWGTVGLLNPVTQWFRLQSNGSTSGADISGSIGIAAKETAGDTGNILVTTNSLSVRPAWVAMRWRQVQATTLKVVNSGQTGVYPGSGSTNTVAMPFTPTSGNTLFAFIAIDKDATSDVTITGWTRVMQERSGSAVSAALFRKVSAGSETNLEVTYTSAASGGFTAFVIEIENEVEIDVSATATTNLSTAAKTSGTATTANTTVAGGLALAFWCNDSYGSCDTSTDEVFSSDFIMAPGPTARQYFALSDVGSPAIAVGWKEIPSSGTAVSTSFTYTGDTDDENLLFLVVLKPSSSGTNGNASGETVTATTSLLHDTPTGGASVSGQTISGSASLTSGAGTGGATASGATQTLSATLIAGNVSAGTGVTATGTTISATASLVVGTASAAQTGTASGSVLSVTGTIIAGTASGVRNVTASGAVLPVSATITAGSPAGSALIAGFTGTVAATLSAGSAAGGVDISGATLSATVTLTAGTASGTANAIGATVTVATELLVGSPSISVTRTGETLAVTTSLTGGTALSLAEASGATVSAAASLIAGEARILAKAGSLTDDFETSFDTSKWQIVNEEVAGDITVSGGKLRIEVRNSYNRVESVRLYDLNESNFAVQVGAGTQTGIQGREVGFEVVGPTATYGWYVSSGGFSTCYGIENGTYTQYKFNSGYTEANWGYLRVRRTGSTIYWERSPNGTTWTVVHTRASAFNMGAVRLALLAGRWASESAVTATFDNVGGGATVANGVTFAPTISLLAGQGAANTVANGTTLTSSAAIIAGTATGGSEIVDQLLVVSASIVSGSATGGAAANGATLSGSAELIAGSGFSGGSVTVSGASLGGAANLIVGSAAGVANISGVVLPVAATIVAGEASNLGSNLGSLKDTANAYLLDAANSALIEQAQTTSVVRPGVIYTVPVSFTKGKSYGFSALYDYLVDSSTSHLVDADDAFVVMAASGVNVTANGQVLSVLGTFIPGFASSLGNYSYLVDSAGVYLLDSEGAYIVEPTVVENAVSPGAVLPLLVEFLPGYAKGRGYYTYLIDAEGADLVDSESAYLTEPVSATANGSLLLSSAIVVGGTASQTAQAGAKLLEASASLLPGTATGVRNGAGQTFAVVTSLLAGFAQGGAEGEALGDVIDLVSAFLPGLASGVRNPTVEGQTIEVSVQVIGGTAAGATSVEATGEVFQVVSVFVPGAASSGQQAPGQVILAVSQIIPGTPRGNAIAVGGPIFVTATLRPGQAGALRNNPASAAILLGI